jgi:flagellar protein FliT
MKTIDLYVSIAEASEHMVNAARASDWDELVAAEKECARRVAALRAHQASVAAIADEAEERRRIDILGKILAHDAEIRELTFPWLKQLEQFLAGTNRERRLGEAYRSDFG